MRDSRVGVFCEGERVGTQAMFHLSLPGSEALMVYSILLRMQHEGEHVMMSLPNGEGKTEAIKNVGRLSDIRAAMRRAMFRTLPNVEPIEQLEAIIFKEHGR